MIKLVSLNIERSKHLDLVLPFLKAQDADVVCLQELMEYDIPRFESELGMSQVFAPGKIHEAEGRPGKYGDGIFSRQPIARSNVLYYRGGADRIVEGDTLNVHEKNATESRSVLCCDIEHEGETYTVATTHFTWTPNGEPDDYQREDMGKLLDILTSLGEFVLTGDFNAPRGGEIFSMLAARYKDNVPPEYKTSIDLDLHRSGHLPGEDMDKKMVDGLFSTPGYVVSDVGLHTGVSDHQAITATVSKVLNA